MRIKSITEKLRKAFKGTAEVRAALAKLSNSDKIAEQYKPLVKKVSAKMHVRDQMFVPGFADHYVETGLSALECIEKSLAAADAPEPKSILVFPSGHGRVLRFIAARFPNAKITAADVDKSGIQFCESSFGAKAFLSSENLKNVNPGIYDLIWSGSLVTHLDKPQITHLLALFHRSLAIRGLCIFSTQGDIVIDRIRHQNFTYSIDEDRRKWLVEQYEGSGFGYVNYPKATDYGLSIISHEQLLKIAEQHDWKEVLFLPAGWRKHQDVYAFQRYSRKRD